MEATSNLPTPSEGQLDHSPHSAALLASHATPLNSVPHCHAGAGKPASPGTSGNHAPQPSDYEASRAEASCHAETRPSWPSADMADVLPSSMALCPSPHLSWLEDPSCPSSLCWHLVKAALAGAPRKQGHVLCVPSDLQRQGHSRTANIWDLSLRLAVTSMGLSALASHRLTLPGLKLCGHKVFPPVLLHWHSLSLLW